MRYVRISLPEQSGVSADHAQHFQPLRQPHVFGLRAKDDKGRSMAQPSFELLSYQVRKAAIKKVNKGHSWVDSLEEAMVDTLVKERFLTTPLARNSWVATKSRSRSRRRSRSREREPRADRSKGRNKGNLRGKGSKGKSKGGNAQEGAWHSSTPDGRQFCYKFNNPQERCRGLCSRVHCCRKCLGSHPQHLCRPNPNEGGKDETQH